MKLTIPQRHAPALRELARLSPKQIDAFAKAVESVQGVPFPSTLAQDTAKSADLAIEDAEAIVRMFASLYLAMISGEGNPQEFAEALVQAIRAEQDQERPKSADAALEAGISRVLSADHTLGTSSKLFDVMYHDERLYCRSNSRLVTDIRPVFSRNPEDGPVAAAIIHELKISYHAGEELREFLVALDSADVLDLIRILTRATEKESALRALMQRANIPCMPAPEGALTNDRSSSH